MNQLEKGFVFEDDRSIKFLITGEAISHRNGEMVYLCQELEAPYRQMIWTAGEIALCVDNGSQEKQIQKDAGSNNPIQEASVEEETAGSRFVGSVEIDDRYRRRIRKEERDREATSIQNRMIAFLDADSYGEKLEILASMKGKATETMLESMALSMDYQTGGSSVEEIYYSLERFLKTRKKYEGSRLR